MMTSMSTHEDQSPVAKFTALVVDDEAIARRTASFALQMQGVMCDTACDGVEALHLMDSASYDLVVIDLRMPNKHGYSLASEILGLDRRPVVIVITAVHEPRIKKDLELRGVDAVYFKPLDYREFAAFAKRALVTRERSLASNKSLPTENIVELPPLPAVKPQAEETNSCQPGSKDESELPEGICDTNKANSRPKSIIAILLQNHERAKKLAIHLMSETIKTTPLMSSDNLYALSNRERVDLVILEQDLGGFLSGLELLERLHKDLVRPNTLLLGNTDGSLDERAKLFGVDMVLDPGSDVEEIEQSVQYILRNAASANSFIPHRARQLVQDYDDMPNVPQLLVKLLKYMELKLEEIPLKQLAQDISVDPKATTDLLKLTNSSSLGLSHEITSVFDAVKLLGPKRAISLIFSSATLAAQGHLLKEWSESRRNWYYHRSVLIANTAAIFAERVDAVSGDTAFVLGLLQDMGILVLTNSFPRRYEAILGRVCQVGPSELTKLEAEDLGITHADVSAALLQRWELPPSIIDLIHAHHNETEAQNYSKIQRSLLRAIRIGEALADLSDVPHSTRRKKLNRQLGQYSACEALKSKALISQAVARTTEACELFNLPTPSPEAYNHLLREWSQHQNVSD